MRVILNIGLAVKGKHQLSHTHVLRELRQTYSAVYSQTFVDSDTAPTLVAIVEAEFPLVGAHFLCRRLGQECIAVYDPWEKVGALEGPGAAQWGAFDQALFFMPNGSRLAYQENLK